MTKGMVLRVRRKLEQPGDAGVARRRAATIRPTASGLPPMSCALQHLGQLEDAGRGDGRDAEQEREARGRVAADAERHRRQQRDPRARHAGDQRQRLRAADDDRVAQRDVVRGRARCPCCRRSTQASASATTISAMAITHSERNDALDRVPQQHAGDRRSGSCRRSGSRAGARRVGAAAASDLQRAQRRAQHAQQLAAGRSRSPPPACRAAGRR